MYRKPARARGPVAVSKSISLPAPVGGWNARDAITEMGPTDAVMLTNWRPLTTECKLREGCTEFATGFSAPVESLMVYSGGNTEKLFAVSNSSFYDISGGGAIGAAAVSGLSNDRWKHVNVATSGGNFLYCANGSDTPYLYNGTTWTSITGVSTPAITGVTTNDLKAPIVFKTRVWFIQKNTLKTWYLPASSVGGAANPIDMSAVAQFGGYIVDHATWTIDAGAGIDDYYVAVTSNGEVIIYQGTDPSSASAWALKGVWRLGSPVGEKCLYKLAGDLLYISEDGLIPLGAALQSSRVNPRVALTDKIQQATSEAVSLYGSNFGWECLYFARDNILILNVPVAEGNSQQQYVMNTISKAWCNFTGWDANCWELYNDQPYYGGASTVCKAFEGNSDNGTNITGTALQSFNDYGNAIQKRFTMMRPMFRSDGSPALLASIKVQFDMSSNTNPLSFTATTYAAWDSATWDTSVWGGGLNVLQSWQNASGVGYYAAPQVKVSSKNIDTRWVSTDIVYESGGIL